MSQESIIDFSIVEIVIPAILFLAVKHPIAELPDVDAEQLLQDHLESLIFVEYVAEVHFAELLYGYVKVPVNLKDATTSLEEFVISYTLEAVMIEERALTLETSTYIVA